MKVEFTSPARAQASAAAAWWQENRPAAPMLFQEELTVAISLLSDGPLLTPVVEEIGGQVVRKARLPRTRYALYFTIEHDLVTVHAVWHHSRGQRPPLVE